MIRLTRFALVVASLIAGLPAEGRSQEADTLPSLHRLAATFVENGGQLEESIAFAVQTSSLEAYFTSEAILLSLPVTDPEPGRTLHARLRMVPLGARETAGPSAERAGRAVVNVYRGTERFEGLRTHSRVMYRELYPGIDLLFSIDDGQLKADWVVAPGAGFDRIRWRYEGATGVALGEGGELVVSTLAGELREAAPWIYQDGPGGPETIAGGYRVKGDTVGFWVGDHDPTRPLVLDPQFEWCTLIGGDSLDPINSIARDAQGNVIVGGYTNSDDFPTTPGAFDRTHSTGDGFIAKFDSQGNLVYSTFLGGSDVDRVESVAVDAAGNAVFSASVRSSDFPVTSGAFDTSFNGATSDLAVGKLDPTGGSLVFSTFLGGGGYEEHTSVQVDASGAVYVAGETGSVDFPTTPGAFDTTYNNSVDAFITKIDPTGSTLVFSTLLGPDDSPTFSRALDVGSDGSVYVTGNPRDATFPTTSGAYDRTHPDMFATKIDPTGSSLVYSTFIGSPITDGASPSSPWALAVDASGRAVIAGRTSAADFRLTPGAFDTTFAGNREGWVLQLDATGSSLVFSTFLGGSESENPSALGIDPSTGNIYVGANTSSPDFPITPGGFGLGGLDTTQATLSILSPDGGRLLFSTLFGSRDGSDDTSSLAVLPNRDVLVGGRTTSSTSFPTTPGAFDETPNGGGDGFVGQLIVPTMLRFVGTPASGQTVHYAIDLAAPDLAGKTALVMLSTTGQSGIPLPGGETIALTFDTATALGIQLGAFLQGTIDPLGQATTAATPFPPVPPGFRFFSAAAVWDLTSSPKVLSVTPTVTTISQ
ncbi:MAG: SBBP repeat-containing protein [Planctomycetota bacterium]